MQAATVHGDPPCVQIAMVTRAQVILTRHGSRLCSLTWLALSSSTGDREGEDFKVYRWLIKQH